MAGSKKTRTGDKEKMSNSCYCPNRSSWEKFLGVNYHDYSKSTKNITQEGIELESRICKKCGHIVGYGIKTIIEEYPVYVCTAPFGIFQRETHGSLTGNYTNYLFGGSGDINGYLTNTEKEVYIVKYFIKDILYTDKIYAVESRIKIDGKFSLEKKVKIYYEYENNILLEKYRCYDRWSTPILHLPSLPKISNPTTTKFQQMEFKIEEETKKP